MRNIILSLLSFLLIFTFSCSDKSNPTLTEEYGKILLKIDKANAPQGISLVRATLSRPGFTNISGTMNILSDSTADLTLNNIQAGLWHLKVEAMNDSMQVLFLGETDVNIIAGFTTQVSLVLQPTGQGTGSISIFVTWGTQQTNFTWIDYPFNPILSGGNNNYDYYGVGQPVLIFDDGKYKMWYFGDGGNAKKYVFYAESNDGINWLKNPNPVLLPGPQGNWDSWAVQPAAVLKENNIYKMYFTAYANQYGPWYIGLATSVDGINWIKRPNPVFYSGTGWETQVAAGSVLKINGKYYLYYTGINSPNYRIGLAISDDGENFTRFSANPILTVDKPWENNGVCVPHVFEDNNGFKMVYMDAANTAFGFAYSNDGKIWNKDNLNPIFKRNQTSNGWADVSIAYPRYIKVGNEIRIYYGGSKNAPPNVYHKIGFFKRSN
jgi:predicted GH43/DUF377 family glycosyl hydrolase